MSRALRPPRWIQIAVVAIIIGYAVGTWLLVRLGLERANSLMGIVAGYLAVTGSVMAVLNWLRGRLRRRGGQSAEPPSSSGRRWSTIVYVAALAIAVAGTATGIAAAVLDPGATGEPPELRQNGVFGYVEDQAFSKLVKEATGMRFAATPRGSREVADGTDASNFAMASLGSELYQDRLMGRVTSQVDASRVKVATPTWSLLTVATLRRFAERLSRTDNAFVVWRPVVPVSAKDKATCAVDSYAAACGYWTLDLHRYFAAVTKQVKWSDYPGDNYGGGMQVRVTITTERKSNSAAMFLGELTTIANRSEPVSSVAEMDQAYTAIKPCAEIGAKQESTTSLVEDWAAAPTSLPLALMYENDFWTKRFAEGTVARADSEGWVPLYVTPLVPTYHVVMAWTDGARKVLEALDGPKVSDLYFQYGYRERTTGHGTLDGGFQQRMRDRYHVAVPADTDLLPLPDAALLDRLVCRFDLARQGSPSPNKC